MNNLSYSEISELNDLLFVANNLSGEMITNVMITNAYDQNGWASPAEAWVCLRIIALRIKNNPDRYVHLRGYGIATLPGLV